VSPEVGVLGGTFDPVHVGHIHVAREVQRILAVERVLLVPSHVPPHKAAPEAGTAAHRLAMLRLAVAGGSGLEVSTLEIDRGGVSYTIDTLDALRGQGLTPLFVLGTDALAELGTWRDHERLISEFDLVAVDRAGIGIAHAVAHLGGGVRVVEVADAALAGRTADGGTLGRGGRIYHLPIEVPAVRSRDIRARATAGVSLRGLVPPEVARYIHERGLYRAGG
jgi:nicotinate-nucleotide adenylyltransferase